nr:hypothetical protein [uncultured Flavobacterium sp.]
MVNCVYIGGENNDEFERFVVIINEKYNPGKDCLVQLENRISTSYTTYLNDFDSLQNSVGSEITGLETDEKKYLNLCYSSETKTFQEKRGEIFSNQSNQIKAYCPYCLLNKPKTLDHYLGQTEYPEYSILIKNLIPCCYDCNQKKGERWRLNNQRRFIHYYNDTFLNHRFLFGTLIFNGNNIPDINFELTKPNNLTIEQFSIIESHFEDLNLIEEYIERSNAILSTEIQIIQTSNQRGDSIETIRQVVVDKHENIIGFGINYWLKCMYEAISINIDNIINIQ